MPYYGYGYGYGGYGYGLTYSWTYLLVLAGVIVCLIASARVRSTYNRYSSVRSMSGMTGAQAAQRILAHAGIRDVQIQHQRGYVPLRVRGAFVPVANFGSSIAWPLIIIGLMMRGQIIVEIGIICFSFAVIYPSSRSCSYAFSTVFKLT